MKDNPLLELTLYFQISFVLHSDEAVHILYEPEICPVEKTYY